jgi:hypothetical protein
MICLLTKDSKTYLYYKSIKVEGMNGKLRIVRKNENKNRKKKKKERNQY